MSADEAEAMIRSGSLGSGNIAPKVEAAVRFVRESGGRAVIAHLQQGVDAVRGRAGTEIVG